MTTLFNYMLTGILCGFVTTAFIYPLLRELIDIMKNLVRLQEIFDINNVTLARLLAEKNGDEKAYKEFDKYIQQAIKDATDKE